MQVPCKTVLNLLKAVYLFLSFPNKLRSDDDELLKAKCRGRPNFGFGAECG